MFPCMYRRLLRDCVVWHSVRRRGGLVSAAPAGGRANRVCNGANRIRLEHSDSVNLFFSSRLNEQSVLSMKRKRTLKDLFFLELSRLGECFGGIGAGLHVSPGSECCSPTRLQPSQVLPSHSSAEFTPLATGRCQDQVQSPDPRLPCSQQDGPRLLTGHDSNLHASSTSPLCGNRATCTPAIRMNLG